LNQTEAAQMAEKRSDDQIKSDRAKISALLLRGWSQKEIAAELSMTASMVCREVKELRAEWIEETKVNLDEALATELARIDRIEREAWEAWEESKKPAKVESQSVTEGQAQKVSVKRQHRTGDKRYMDIIMWCAEHRAKLLGLIKNKVAVGGDPDNPIQHVHSAKEMTDDQLAEIISRANGHK
jgi:predicted transcriptional regulator